MRAGCKSTGHLTLTFLLTLFVSHVTSQSCNITNIYDENNEEPKYFATEHDDHCYILDLKKYVAKDARVHCRRIGGHLTDINEQTQTFLESLIRNVSAECHEFDTDYWIGLLFSDSLDQWYWDNGANFDYSEKLKLSILGRFAGSCIALQDKSEKFEWNNKGCSGSRHFICKIPPPGGLTCTAKAQSMENNTATCSICQAALQKRFSSTPSPSTTTTPPTTTTTPPSITENVTSVANVTEDSGEQNAGRGDKEGGDTEERTGFEETESASCDKVTVLILPAALGAALALSLLINVVFVCLVCRRRNSRGWTKKDNKSVPMVDILSVDKEPRSPGETSQLYSEDELLYANDSGYDNRETLGVDGKDNGRQTSKDRHKFESPEDESNFYNNTNVGKGNANDNGEIKGAANSGSNYSEGNPDKGDQNKGKSSTPIYTEPVKNFGEKATTNSVNGKPRYLTMTSATSRGEGQVELESDSTYSKLNRDGDQGKRTDNPSAVDHVYGMQSASAPLSGSDVPSNTEIKDTSSPEDPGSDEYSKLNREEQSNKSGDPQHVYGLQSKSGPFDDFVEYQNQSNKEQASEYESYT